MQCDNANDVLEVSNLIINIFTVAITIIMYNILPSLSVFFNIEASGACWVPFCSSFTFKKDKG